MTPQVGQSDGPGTRPGALLVAGVPDGGVHGTRRTARNKNEAAAVRATAERDSGSIATEDRGHQRGSGGPWCGPVARSRRPLA
jgi:hypothetical protein